MSTLTESVPGLLTVEAGATVVIGTGSLTVGTLSTAVSGTSAFSISSGTLHVTGTSSLGSTIIAAGPGIIQLDLAVTLAQTLTLGSTGGTITLGGTVDGAAANTQDFTVDAGTGTISLGGAVGGGTTLKSISLTSTNAAANAITIQNVTTGGGGVQSYNGNVTLGAATTLISTNNNVSFSAKVNGAQALALTAGTGTVTFNGVVGGGTNLASLTVNSASLFTNVAGITVAGAGAISITADDVAIGAAISTGSGPITIQPVTAAQAIRLNDAAGGLNITAVELALLTTTGTVTIGSAAGTGTISIGNAGPLPLGGTGWAGLSLVGASSNVQFNLAGANTLTLPNNKTFNTTIGTGVISNPGGAAADVTIGGLTGTVTFTSAGGVTMTAAVAQLGASTTTGAITYTTTAGMAVVGAVASGGGNIALKATGITINSAGVAVNAGAGNLTLNPTAGGVTQTLGSITASGLELLGTGPCGLGGIVNTVTTVAGNVAGNIALRTAGVASVGTVNLTVGLTTTAGGTISLNVPAALTQTQIITAAGGLELLGTGPDNLGGMANAVTVVAGNVAGNIALRTAGALAVGTVNATLGLTTTAGGAISITVAGVLTQTQKLVSAGLLTLTAGANNATLNLAANSFSTVSVVSGAAVSLNSQNAYTLSGATVSGNFTAVTNTAGTITVTGLVDASGGAGTVSLTPVGNIILNYGLGPVITTAAGNIQLQQAVTLSANADLKTTGGNISFTSTVDGGHTLALTAAAGTVTFNGPVGGGINLSSLTINSTSLMTNVAGATITVAGAGAILISADDVSIGAGISTGSGPITIQPVTAAQAIRLNDAAGGLNITAVELVLLTTTGTVTIGSAAGTGTISIGNAGPLPLGGTGWAGLSLAGASSNVQFNLAAANTLTLPNNATFNTTIGTGVITAGAAVADVTIGGLTGTVTFTSAGGVTMTAAVAQLSASTTTGAITYTTTAGMAVVGAVNSGGNAIALNAGVGQAFSNAAAGTINAGASSVSITSNTIALAGTVTGDGGINLIPDANATTVGLNDGGGTFNMSVGALSLLSTTGIVTIGRAAAGTGAMTIGGLGPINLVLQSWAGLSLVGASCNVQFDLAGAQTLTLPNNSTFRTTIGTGAISNPGGSTADVTIGGAAGIFNFTSAGAVTMTASVGTLGFSTTTGALTFTDTTALTVIGGVSSTNNNISLRGVGFALAAGVPINSGTGTMTINGGAQPINLNTGTVTTTNNTAAALTIRNATTVALGNINAVGGAAAVVTLGFGDITGLVTQTAATTLNATTVSVDTTSTITLGNLTNTVAQLDPVTRGGAFTLVDSVALTLMGSVGANASPVSITTTAGVLALGANSITTTGANNISLTGAGGVTQLAGSTVDAGAGTILVDGGGQSMNFNTGTLTTTNAGAAITIQHATIAVALGNITAINGTLSLGTALLPLSVAITQNGAINVSGLSVAGGTITLPVGLNLAGNLTVISGTVTLGANLSVGGDISILAAGSLDVSPASYQITLTGNWSNAGTFVQHSGIVQLTPVALVTVSGNNTFYVFRCLVPNAQINFQAGATQTIAAGGDFNIAGTLGNNIVLNSTTLVQWIININLTATVTMNFVDVYYSNAFPNPIIIPANVNAGGGAPWFDTGWLNIMIVLTSDTQDTNNNGKIDRILVNVPAAINDDFSNFVAVVPGYSVTGYGDPGFHTNQFYISLQDGTVLDTGVVPLWNIVTNTSLKDQLTLSKLVGPIGPSLPTTDTATPILGYTLAVAGGQPQIYVHFSEPVLDVGLGPLTMANFALNNPLAALPLLGLVQLSPTEYLVPLNAALTPDDIARPQRITTVNVVDASPAHNPLNQAATGHRVSDLGLGLPTNGMMEPMFAHDETQSGPFPGGIGLIQVGGFDGSKWLRSKQNITLEGHVYAPLVSPPALGGTMLWYDIDVPAADRNGGAAPGVWLPSFFTDDVTAAPPAYGFSGLVPMAVTGDTQARSLTELGGSTAQLRNFLIPGTDPKDHDGAVLDFLFQMNFATGQTMFTARVANPLAANWYQQVTPWTFVLRDIRPQRGGVQILNNVINPDKGQVTTLQFIQGSAGNVTITVFDLSGSIIRVLVRGNQAAGDYGVTWDGTNRSGAKVTRGLYFIRVVGPGMDEIRKVLVVR